jgi:hypothetical protein
MDNEKNNWIEKRTTTALIRSCGFSAKSKVSAFNKSQCYIESKVLFNPPIRIHSTLAVSLAKGVRIQ